MKKDKWKYKHIKPNAIFAEIAEEMLNIIKDTRIKMKNTIDSIDLKKIKLYQNQQSS